MLNKAPSINCSGCGACANACPRGCITLAPNEEGFLHPVIDSEKCIGCDRCLGVCPSLHKVEAPAEQTDAVAIVNYILGNPSANYVAEASDVNGDGRTSITDAVAIVNKILSGESEAKDRMARKADLLDPQ